MSDREKLPVPGGLRSRRNFLRTLGVAGAVVASGVAGIGNPLPNTARAEESILGKFGRMFGDLPSFAPDTPEVRAALIDLGSKAG